jgi:hypothetical protein
MSQTLNILKLALLIPIGAFFLLLFWVYLIPEILLGILLRKHSIKWPIPILALLIVIANLFITGRFFMRMGDMTNGPWYVLCLGVLIDWAIAVVFVSPGYMMPKTFIEGFTSGKKQSA